MYQYQYDTIINEIHLCEQASSIVASQFAELLRKCTPFLLLLAISPFHQQPKKNNGKRNLTKTLTNTNKRRERNKMPWQSIPPLIIIGGAFNVAAGLIWGIQRLQHGEVRLLKTDFCRNESSNCNYLSLFRWVRLPGDFTMLVFWKWQIRCLITSPYDPLDLFRWCCTFWNQRSISLVQLMGGNWYRVKLRALCFVSNWNKLKSFLILYFCFFSHLILLNI